MMRTFSRRQGTQTSSNSIPPLPPPSPNQTYVRVAPLDGGQYTEPAGSFVYPPDSHDPYAVVTVPSLPFIIEHPGTTRFNRHGDFAKPCNILFDRGLRSDVSAYSQPARTEVEHRQPIRSPDPLSKQLSRGGLSVQDIDLVVLSHMHWSHTGDAADLVDLGPFYLVGPGAIPSSKDMIQTQPHRVDSSVLLPRHRTIQLPFPGSKGAYSSDATKEGALKMEWQLLGPFLATVDLFNDGSVYAVDLPGHTQGHIGLLCRCSPSRWALLAGDVVHDSRLLNGERAIATWKDKSGRETSIHDDQRLTEDTLSRIRMLIEGERLGGYQIEVILSHDMNWVLSHLQNFWPSCLFHNNNGSSS